MDLKQIQYFIALFEDGSVTRAAKRLHIVQPALSMQIARLEEALNQKLFERGAHGMSPTAAGRQMYRLFLPIMRDITHAREQLVQRDEVVSGNITIGLIASIAEGALAEALTSFRVRYPQVEVTVADGYSTTLIDWVAGGQLDVAIINKPRAQLSLDSRPLLDEEMVLATSAAHGPDLPGSVQLASLPEVELVLPTKRHGLRGVLDSAAHQLDMMLTPKYEIDALGTIVKLVASTNMATILPRIAVQRAVDRGTLRVHAILAPRLIRHIVRISHPRRPLSTAAEALVSIIASEIQHTSDAATPAGSQDLNKEKME
jgi:DNA-binding transcriptional LysR family regulator